MIVCGCIDTKFATRLIAPVMVTSRGSDVPPRLPVQPEKLAFDPGVAVRVSREPAGYVPPGVTLPFPFAYVVSAYIGSLAVMAADWVTWPPGPPAVRVYV